VIAAHPGTSETELIAFIRRWFALLAVGARSEACAALDEPNIYGQRWGPGDIQRCVEEGFPPGCRFRVKHPEELRFTDPDAATGGDRRPEVMELTDGSGCRVDHDVPLNGEWSDLTAQFEFVKRPGGYAVVLHDLHVL
jgi:hypothetical protein